MPSRVVYNAPRAWLNALLRKFRVPVVFVMSALASYCAFQEAGVVSGTGGMGPTQDDTGRVHVTLWDADMMPSGQPLSARPESIRKFGDELSPDVLVVYRVPDFDTLLKLRDRLGLYGYTAVMSNFTCGGTAGEFRWPIEIAILSRFPIDEATEYDATPESLAACAHPGPFTDGPARANRAPMAIPPEVHMVWPTMRSPAGTVPRPGTGFLTARIAARRVAIAAVIVPTADGYPGVSLAELDQMRHAITAAAGGWVWTQREADRDYHYLIAGDFMAQQGNVVQPSAGFAKGIVIEKYDGVNAILTAGRIGSDPIEGPGNGSGLRMIDLTQTLVSYGVGPGQVPHSDRIYAGTRLAGVFSPAMRATEAYGSRDYPVSVVSSGASCGMDPFLEWRHNGGLSQQVFTAGGSLLAEQLDAMHAAGNHGNWAVVLKLDDVIVDNSPLLYRAAQACTIPTQQQWDAWIAEGKAPLMPGVASFIAKVGALAADGTGNIVILTVRQPDQARATEDYLQKMFPDAPGLFEVLYGITPQNRAEAYDAIARSGARILYVIGNDIDQFPGDPDLPVGGTDKSCPLPADGSGPAFFGSQTARFGVCYSLLPGIAQ